MRVRITWIFIALCGVPFSSVYAQQEATVELAPLAKEVKLREFLVRHAYQIDDESMSMPLDLTAVIPRRIEIMRPVPAFEGVTDVGVTLVDAEKRLRCATLAKELGFKMTAINGVYESILVSDYLNACTTRANGADTVLLNGFPISLRALQGTLGSLSLIQNDVQLIFCTAISINETEILTARHCFGEHGSDDSSAPDTRRFLADCVQGQEKCSIVFIPADAPTARIRISGPAQTMRGVVSRESDFFRLILSSPRIPAAKVRFQKPHINQKALLVGPIGVFRSSTASVEQDWRRGADFMPCGFHRVGASTAAHTCQAWPGFSGAPLVVGFEGDGVSIVVAGIHLGAAELRDAEFQDDVAVMPGFTTREVVNLALSGNMIQ